MSLRFYFSKQQLLYANSYNDTMLAHGTLIHECTAEQMTSFQTTCGQSTKS